MKNDYPLISSFDPRSCTSGQISWIQRNIQAVYRKHLKPFNITSSQLSILFVTSKRPGVTQVEICKILALEKSTLSRNLIRLTKEELLENRKSSGIFLTEVGKIKLEGILPSWEAAKQEVSELIQESGLEALATLRANFQKNADSKNK